MTNGSVVQQETAAARAVEVLATSLTFRTQRPGRSAATSDWPTWADPEVVARLRASGVTSLWKHQSEAADLVFAGADVALATGTASGKSLAYLLPALTWARAAPDASACERRCTSPRPRRWPPTRRPRSNGWPSPLSRAAVVDGDATREERDWARQHADVLLTNPDMLHRSLLPSHRRWGSCSLGCGWWSWTSRTTTAECSVRTSPGCSGACSASPRLRGRPPRVLLLSATMADPEQTGRLTGRTRCTAVRRLLAHGTDGRPACRRHGRRTGGRTRRAVGAGRAVRGGHQTIAFVRSRQATESMAADTNARCAEPAATRRWRPTEGVPARGAPALERTACARRAGRGGGYHALELGVDIAGMDAVMVSGWPGTRAAFWQQAGRAGRDARGSLAVFLAGADPLEQYVAAHPEVLVGAPLERTVIDPSNPFVVAPQVCAAAAETPWRTHEVAMLPAEVVQVIDELTAAGTLRRRADGWYWPRRERPSDRTDIRGRSGAPIRLVEVDTGRLLGTVDAGRAPVTVHPGAVYVHQGAVFLVTELDLDDGVALLVTAAPDHQTQARSVSAVRIVAEQARCHWGGAEVAFGMVDVTTQVVGYQKRNLSTGAVLAEVPLDMPEQRLRTAGCWWTLPDDLVAATGLAARRLPGAAHAAEHAAIGMLPLFATCDRWDVGGVSTARHPDTDRLTVVVHDAVPGGAGFAARGYDAMADWLAATRDAIAACACDSGCPACVQSPKCGNGNALLDKPGAVALLTTLLGQSPG
jgi:DEAD/DEAH box helicase domain-containing protein